MDDADPHWSRTPAILAAHPEIRRLFGRNPWTTFVALGVVVFQTLMAMALGRWFAGNVLAVVLAAACIGAFANHAMYVVIHDATHSLIFKRLGRTGWS